MCIDYNLALLYVTMVSYGVNVISPEDMDKIVDDISPKYVPEQTLAKQTEFERGEKRNGFIWGQSKTIAVNKYFQKMKESGAKSIFEIINVDVREVTKETIKKLKS